MRRFWLLVLVFFVGTAHAQEAGDGAVRDTIRSQIEAFQADDFETAFEFASPAIRDIFRTPGRFGEMVRRGFPMVWKPDAIEFQDSKSIGPIELQRLMIRDQAGRFHFLEYEMVQTPNGWKINGVRMLTAPQIGA